MEVRIAPKAFFSLAVGLIIASATVCAAPIDLSIADSSRIGTPGQSFLFQGTITNNTGSTLSATELFFDFSGYDPLNVILGQLLGFTSFSIPTGSTSDIVDLFKFDLETTAAVPEIYSAVVVLQSTGGYISNIQTVTVTTVPEPRSLALTAIGVLAILLSALRRRSKLLPVVCLVIIAPTLGIAQVSAVQFLTTAPGVTQQDTTLMVALPILNNGTVTATSVQVTGATLQTAPLITTLPVALGPIAADASVVFQANFNATGLVQNTPYLLTIRGTYQVGGSTAGFTLNRFISVPPVGPGSASLTTATVDSNVTSGAPFPPRPPLFGPDVNKAAPPVPTGTFIPGTPTLFGTSSMQVPSSPAVGARSTVQPLALPITFSANNGLGTLNLAGTTAEPSGATGGGVIFVTYNWGAAYSTNGGASFTEIDPTTIFPNDAVGYCCDQIVQYVPSIDRFIWLLQGNGYRMASASPAAIIASGGTAWTYWNLTPNVFGACAGFDYPDLSVGNNSLYLSWDAGFGGCSGGFQVVRTSFAGIQAGGTITVEFTDPALGTMAWGSHLMQNTLDEIFWAGHNSNSEMRIFSLAEGSGTYFWRDINVSSWANNAPTSLTPDGQDWLAKNFNGPGGNSFPRNGVIGAARSGNQLWFAWTAGTDNNFRQAHIEIVAFDRNNNFNRIQQVQIWNDSYAFAYPSLSTNACTGEIGLSHEYGGNGNYENHVVGFWGDFVVYITTNSNVGTTRFGDYVTIRQNPRSGSAFMTAFGYGLNTTLGGATQTDIRHVVFGRLGCELPDLIPEPDRNGNFCRIDNNGNLVVTVRNQGPVATGATTTRVDFGAIGIVDTPTPGLPAGASVDLRVPIPLGCFNPDCGFRIIVDVLNDVTESNEAENIASGTCIG